MEKYGTSTLEREECVVLIKEAWVFQSRVSGQTACIGGNRKGWGLKGGASLEERIRLPMRERPKGTEGDARKWSGKGKLEGSISGKEESTRMG